jgi:dipeptidyl aminopeptidase/acylaminoacyl peptidase
MTFRRPSYACWSCLLFTTLMASFLVSLSFSAYALDTKYQLPAPELQALVDAPRGPEFKLGPKNRTALLLDVPPLPSIKEISTPEFKLAGLRVREKMRAETRFNFYDGINVLDIASGAIRKVSGLPAKVKIADLAWSPDERWVAFSIWTPNGVELWMLDVRNAQVRRLIREKINAVTGSGFSWLKGSEQLLVRLIPLRQSAEPQKLSTPKGPSTQETMGGRATMLRTYPDLLRTNFDADMLDWQLQTQLAVVSVQGAVKRFGPSLTLFKLHTSPDGNYVLTTQLQRPYSSILPIERFGQVIDVWDVNGKKIKNITTIPMRERPTASDGVTSSPRHFGWRNDQPATLFWLEAQVGGDAKPKVQDIIMQQGAPFGGSPQKLMELAWRFDSVLWGSDGLALVTEVWPKSHNSRTWKIRPGAPYDKPELIFNLNTDDQYNDPGIAVTELNDLGRSVIRTTSDGESLFFAGVGASAEGDRPFLDRFNIASKESTRLWRSRAPYYEDILGVLDDQGHQIITSRESSDERPNLFVRNVFSKTEPRRLTNFAHPMPQMKGIKRLQIAYKREDGVNLSATLYLPPNYDPKRDGPRPMLMWAYPREYKTTDTAGQINGSPYKFNRINIYGPQAMLARGYTVLDDLAMPIIGEGKAEPNDTFIRQIRRNARAAVEKVVEMGVADKDKIAIGGHSYGAFMAANLIAHTSLFRAAIARSGAYNRSLTPFGFQQEDRNYWKATETYQEMSPFTYAYELDVPILLVHGEEDSNPGTQPMQSERLYQAVQGLGLVSRLVMLPNEGHVYYARESMMHLLWEQDRWMTRFVKNAKPKK